MKPTHYVVVQYPDRQGDSIYKTTKKWKAIKKVKELKYSDYPEGTTFGILSKPPKTS